jgi:folate-binding protein YgfZ
MSERSSLHEVTAASGAEFADDAGWLMPLHFSTMADEYHQARTGAVLFDRSHHGKIQVSGPDAPTFLHNLCSNDVKSLKPGSGCESFLTTAKAKVVAHIYLWRTTEVEPQFWLDTGPGTASTVLKHLDHYLISEQVELTDRTRDFAQLHLAGPKADSVAEVVRLRLADQSLATSATEPLAIPHQLLAIQGYDILCLPASAASVWNALLQAGAMPAGQETYETLRIEAGMPRQGVDMDDERFVVEIGRIKQAISYTKGCYLGQEPIVMARDRGHVNRLLVGLRIAGLLAVPSGAKVYRDGAEVGAVTSSVVSPRLGSIALAYLRRGSWDVGTEVQVAADSESRNASVVGLPFEGAGVGSP